MNIKKLNEELKKFLNEGYEPDADNEFYYAVSVGDTWNHSSFKFKSEREVQEFFNSHHVEDAQVMVKKDITDQFTINHRDANYNTNFEFEHGYSPYIKKIEPGDIVTVERNDIGFESIVAPNLTEQETEDILNKLNITDTRYVDYGMGRHARTCLRTGIQLRFIKAGSNALRQYYYSFYLENSEYPETFIIKLETHDFNRLLAL